jgi:Fic family protein
VVGQPGLTHAQPFVPQPLPPSELSWTDLIPVLGRANRSLATYAGIFQALRDPAVLLSPLTTQEAVLSSKIEGTQATLGDVLKYEAGEPPRQSRRADDIVEILNYRKALRSAEGELPARAFSLNILKGLHAILLDGTRGADKKPGQFRTEQNWIGPEDCPIEQASFVPPAPTGLIDHLEAWERFYRSEQPDPLVQLAVIHAQFEIIHPFRDGNGRIGRILIPLFLFEKRLLPRPMFYLSSWLESRRDEYIARLRALGRAPNAWNDWSAFFLRGIDEQAAANAITARQILDLYESLKKRALDLTRSQYAVPLLDQMFKRPVFRSSHLDLGPRPPSKQSVFNLLQTLSQARILTVLRKGAGRRPTVYALAELVNLCEGKRVF